MTLRTATLGGRRYRITRRLDKVYDGLVDVLGPVWGMNVDPRLQGKSELETFIHEALHAQAPSRGESAIDARAKELTRLLWRLGYRRRG